MDPRTVFCCWNYNIDPNYMTLSDEKSFSSRLNCFIPWSTTHTHQWGLPEGWHGSYKNICWLSHLPPPPAAPNVSPMAVPGEQVPSEMTWIGNWRSPMQRVKRQKSPFMKLFSSCLNCVVFWCTDATHTYPCTPTHNLSEMWHERYTHNIMNF